MCIQNKLTMKIKTLLLALVSLLSCSKQNDFLLSSPNEELQITITNKNNTSTFSVIYANDTILNQSPIGLQIGETNFTENVSFKDFTEKEINETWKTINGKQPTVQNHYKAYTFKITKTNAVKQYHEIVFRLYDKGFAYRYNFPSGAIKDSLLIKNELTELHFKDDFKYWAYNGENNNLGPVFRSQKSIEMVRTPTVLQLSQDNYIAIHEAEIIEFEPFSINASGKEYSLAFNTNFSSRKEGFKTSWRSFILGNKPGDLVESNLLINLNAPCEIEDTSWILPGKTLWDWRVWGYKSKDGFEYGLNTISHKRFIDFASENNIQYLLIDADWYGDEFNQSSNPTTSKKGVDIKECMRYAKEKDVGIILYLNDIGAKQFGLERVLKQFSEWGAIGVKYGFMRGSWEDKVKHTRNVVKLCAKYKLMVNFHDSPVPPSGDRRTYPNLVTKEFGHSQADAKKSYFPEKAVTSPFINMIAGPLDMCNGWFDLNGAHSRVKVFEEIPGTVAAEVAKLIVCYTGWMVLPDSPEAYLKKNDLFDCIRNMPAQFNGFKVIDGVIGEYISVARRAGDDWFIGSLTNRDPRTIAIDFSFLPKNNTYEATFYEDADDTHFLNNKESYSIRKHLVNSETRLSIKMAAGGGNSIYLKKINNQ